MIRIFTESHVGHVQIHLDDYLTRPKIYKSISDKDEIETILSADTRIIGFAPRIYSPALSFSEEDTAMVQLIGVDAKKETTVSRLREKIVTGSFFSSQGGENDRTQAMVGKGLAIKLGLNINDEFIVIGQGADGSIANDVFVVSAIIGKKSSGERMNVYLPLQALQEFLSMELSVHEYSMLLEDVADSRSVAKDLQKKLPELVVSPWQEVEEMFYKSMEADKQGNWVFLVLLMIIVFIGVLNTVLMSVLERTREFGVLRAIGYRSGTLVNLIFMETVLLSMMSLILGVIIALPSIMWFSDTGFMMPEPMDMGGIEFQHFKGELTAQILFLPMGIILLFAALISLFPAIRAARLDPADALGKF